MKHNSSKKAPTAAKQADLREIELLRQKVTDLTLQKPEKAAKILELWLKVNPNSRQKTATKKAA
jgi:hypothetical protein